MTLRSRLIRLAYQQPSLRHHLLPVLKEAAGMNLGTFQLSFHVNLVRLRYFGDIGMTPKESDDLRYDTVSKILRKVLPGVKINPPKVHQENNRGSWITVMEITLDTGEPPSVFNPLNPQGELYLPSILKELRKAGFKPSRVS